MRFRAFCLHGNRRLWHTTNILYQARGVECSARPGHQISSRYHCWITEQAIPLDEFIQCNYAVKSKCTLAAFCCILRAAEHGLYLSDNHFYNFGVKITSDATEHRVVTEYSGGYTGHGQSKTILKLHCHGETFHGCILKVRKNKTRLRALCLHASTELWHHQTSYTRREG